MWTPPPHLEPWSYSSCFGRTREASKSRSVPAIQKTGQEWTAQYLGRLWELPCVVLKECKTSVQDYWSRAPRTLRKRASRTMVPWKREVWKVLRKRLPTQVVPQVPVWIEAERVGYVLDFLIPEFGVSMSLHLWEARFEADELPGVDFEAEPDHPYNDDRTHDLREYEGIEDLQYWDVSDQNDGAEGVASEVRKELGYGRPPWMHRQPHLEPSKVAPQDA